MRVLRTVEGLQCYLQQQRWRAKEYPQTGFVPTMGGLHEGHLSLIRRARQENDLVVVSIFVNPLQFGPEEDLNRYPKTQTRDIQLCQARQVDVVFMPIPKVLYGTNTPTDVQLTRVCPPATMTAVLCGPHRPGHFDTGGHIWRPERHCALDQHVLHDYLWRYMPDFIA